MLEGGPRDGPATSPRCRVRIQLRSQSANFMRVTFVALFKHPQGSTAAGHATDRLQGVPTGLGWLLPGSQQPMQCFEGI